MKKLEIKATISNLQAVQTFISEQLENAGANPKAIMQISIAAEEIFVNIAHYAYAEKKDGGMATIVCNVLENPKKMEITFIDSGIEFNPLAKKDADITLCASQREIGGLGILMVKKSMDETTYKYENGNNVFLIAKNI